MSAQNNFKGKFQEGTFANGEGPILGVQVKIEAENKGLLMQSGPQRYLKTQGGQGAGDGLDGRSEEKGFDIYGKTYRGPQNMAPKNMGEVPNFNVNK